MVLKLLKFSGDWFVAKLTKLKDGYYKQVHWSNADFGVHFIHALSDKRCFELAGQVRVVLGELSDRLSQALKDEAELTKALSTLIE
jgi:hypothetical protein